MDPPFANFGKLTPRAQKKKAPSFYGRGLYSGLIYRCFLLRDYIGGTWAFFALPYLELHRSAFLQVGSTSLNFGMVNEQVLTSIVRNDKPKALFHVKPFDFTCTHFCSFGQK